MSVPDSDYVNWLVSRSMLAQARERAKTYGGQARLWRHPYAETRPRAASEVASVWFTAYPASIVTREGESVLKTLGDPQLWQGLSSIGVQAIHTGPTKAGGGFTGYTPTPSIDGNFDRISFDIDRRFGTEDEYLAISRLALAFNAVVIDDVIPSHTGKGADFRLPELGYADYPGLYHMV